jgi:radical SAM superfamily enzyme YgiQ (UPF0313 family)
MPHVALVAMSGFRVREREMIALGMQLPGLHQRAGAVAALPALGLLTLAGLTPPHWSISYHESAASPRAAADEIIRTKPTLVAISALTASILDAYALADLLRAENISVVIGGLHATTMPDEAALHADAVVIGDGEPVWQELLADAERSVLRPRYRAAHPFDLANAPLPRFDLLGTKDRPRYTLQTSRGCPLACDFCGASRLLGPYRTKPAALVERELAEITACCGKGRTTIELADDNTFAARRDAPALLAALECSGVRYFTECDWRIGEHPEILERLAASGCVQILVGVETLGPRHNGMGAKAAPIRRVLDALHAVQNAGVAVIGCFVIGGDGEDLESLHALGEHLLDSPLADIQLTLQTPFPGTAVRARLEREGRLLPDRGWESCTLFDLAYQPDRLSVEQMESGFRNLVKYVFAEAPTRRREQIRRDVWANRYARPPTTAASEAA